MNYVAGRTRRSLLTAPRNCRCVIRVVTKNQIEKCFNVPVTFDGVAQRQIRSNLIVISPTGADSLYVAGCLKFGDDPLYRSFRDSDSNCDITHQHFRFCRNAQEDVGMICKESPVWNPGWMHL